MHMKLPEISIILPIHNAAKYLKDCIDSIINQSFTNFELLAIDDGSTDNSTQILESYSDNRINIHSKSHNFISSLNWGIRNAKGKYLARMDADDIMHIDRLRIQYNIMQSDPRIDICSTWAKIFGDIPYSFKSNQCLMGYIRHPLLFLLRNNFIFHPSTMIKRKFLTDNGLEYENYIHAEDYKLWVEAAKKKATFYVEGQELLYYRIHKNQVGNMYYNIQHDTSIKIYNEILDYLNSFLPDDINNFICHLNLMEKKRFIDNTTSKELLFNILKKYLSSHLSDGKDVPF